VSRFEEENRQTQMMRDERTKREKTLRNAQIEERKVRNTYTCMYISVYMYSTVIDGSEGRG
jgi:hypothetical protein